MDSTYERIGPLGKGPGCQETETLEGSAAVALRILGGEEGGPPGRVPITKLGSESMGSDK